MEGLKRQHLAEGIGERETGLRHPPLIVRHKCRGQEKLIGPKFSFILIETCVIGIMYEITVQSDEWMSLK
ncbi:hypothetical protein J6590_089817 [Homalodisca vitripennis]|nr:hypothetical protein J6590_089817 [Homalodisca vitripennis]